MTINNFARQGLPARWHKRRGQGLATLTIAAIAAATTLFCTRKDESLKAYYYMDSEGTPQEVYFDSKDTLQKYRALRSGIGLDEMTENAIPPIINALTFDTPYTITAAEMDEAIRLYDLNKHRLRQAVQEDDLSSLFREPSTQTGPSAEPISWKAYDEQSRNRQGSFVKKQIRRTQHRT